jgi:hypothetical protein
MGEKYLMPLKKGKFQAQKQKKIKKIRKLCNKSVKTIKQRTTLDKIII